MKVYEEKPCAVCGKVFQPTHAREKYCCKECAREGGLVLKRRWQARHAEQIREMKREWARKKRADDKGEAYMPKGKSKAKTDNIIAIGYAERQIAASLKLAGKVRTEL